MKKKFLFGGFVLIMVLFGYAKIAEGMVISPTKYLISLDPGGSGVAEVTVENNEEVTREYELSVLVITQDDQGHSLIKKDSIGPEISWIQPELDKITLGPAEKANVKFIIDVPRDAAAGSYYLGLAATLKPDESSGSGMGGQLATLLHLKIAGLANESLDITEWKISKLVFNRDWRFMLTAQNNGNMEVPMNGTYTLRDWRGQEIGAESMSLGNMLVAGETRRAFFTPGTFSEKRLWPGRYEAEAKIVFGQTKQIATQAFYFWYLPKWFVAILGILILVIIYFSIKKFTKHEK